MEPILELSEIQGNILPGFRLPFQRFVSLRVVLKQDVQSILKFFIPMITNADTCHKYHQVRIKKAKATRLFGYKSYFQMDSQVFWVNIAVGRHKLRQLNFEKPFIIDSSFEVGLAHKSTSLGDPADPNAEGNHLNWKVGGPANESDVFLIFASSKRMYLDQEVNRLFIELKTTASFDVQYDEVAERLPNDTEHFGFKDGISQPGIRGMISGTPPEFYSARKVVAGNDDLTQPEFSDIGKLLAWPGQFVFGYPKQSRLSYRDPLQGVPEENDQHIRNGSFLVFRRLKQDVAGFYNATDQMSAMLESEDVRYKERDYLRSKLVGRFKDGTSILLEYAPVIDKSQNHFAFTTAIPELTMKDGTTVNFRTTDPMGEQCPFFSHTRKVNPRDAANNQGSGRDTLTFQFLRRGIPFGPPYDFSDPDNPLNKSERGLHFISYQTSIQNQFELVTHDWMNSSINPEGGEGHDLLVGQHTAGISRSREAKLKVNGKTFSLEMHYDFIIPTGGEYLFVPSIATLTHLSNV